MNDLDKLDIFTDESFVEDPYPYYDHLRATCPVQRLDHLDVVAVTGYDEMAEVFRDNETFSSCNAMGNFFAEIDVAPGVEDIGDLIEAARPGSPLGNQLFTLDDPVHAQQRSLLMRLFTPKRMRENEESMVGLSNALIDRFIDAGSFAVHRQYAQPFGINVIADLLGVPESDHALIRRHFGGLPGINDDEGSRGEFVNPLDAVEGYFIGYIEDRRREPTDDVMTYLAESTYPDGTVPEVDVVARVATFLFAAGGDTTSRLLLSVLKVVAEDPDLQQQLREQRDLIPSVIEETLRQESVVKTVFRKARRAATVGGVDIPVGGTVMLMPGAANHDPARFEHPDEFHLDRENAKEHLSFGRGHHACPGGPLARVETRVSLNRLFDRMSEITISEAEHGPPDARRYSWDPTYILRGLSELHLDFTPAGSTS